MTSRMPTERDRLGNWLDGFAVCASVTCLIHCLALPLLVAALPTITARLNLGEGFHAMILLFAVPTSAYALVGGWRRHREFVPLMAGIAGLVLMAVAPLGVGEARDVIAGETMIFNVSDPTLELFRPAPGQANGTAVIVAPGGGFVGLGFEAGGTAVARRLAQLGVTAFVLKYRTIRSPNTAMHMPEVHMREMETVIARAKTGTPHEMPRFAGEAKAVADGVRAMAIVRKRAAEWGIDPHKVGMIGFSSGAYLAADLAIGDKASRPDFVALIYGGLRTPVPVDAPPAFIAGAADDEYQTNDPLLLFSAWRKAGAPAEVHIYESGGHGFSLTPKGVTSDHWFVEFVWWMQSRPFGRLATSSNLAIRMSA